MLSSLVLQKDQLYLIVKTDAAQFCFQYRTFSGRKLNLEIFLEQKSVLQPSSVKKIRSN
jgi:hypothetical protein